MVLITDYIKVYAKMHLPIRSVKVYNYPSAELTFVSLTFNTVTKANRPTEPCLGYQRKVSPGGNFLIKV